jgi:hypothetical protein
VKISHPDLKARAAPAQERDLDRARTRGSVRSPQEVTSAGTVNAFAPPSSEHSEARRAGHIVSGERSFHLRSFCLERKQGNEIEGE